MKLSWFNTSMRHKVYLANEYVQYKTMQDITEKEFRDSGSNANTKIPFEVRATSLRPRLHTEGFSLYVHTGPSTKGPPLRNYNSTLRVHYSSLKTQSPLHKRDRHKGKAKKRLQPWWSNDYKQHLVITIDHKRFFSKKQDPIHRIRDDSSSVRKQSVWKWK